MCGIFGVNIGEKIDTSKFSVIKKDISYLTKLSEARGSDTFGILISLKKENFIYKINTEPNKALRRKDYKIFLENIFNKSLKEGSEDFSFIGQTRLVTNGAKFLHSNNQPIITKELLGVHNGIIASLENKKNEKTVNLEGYNIKSDSLEFFENLSSIIENKKNFIENYLQYLKSIRGNYSIAFRIPSLLKTVISSNCGSLYYFNNEKVLVFASEKNFLLEFLRNSKFLRSYIDHDNFESKISKILNYSIVYDEKNKNVTKLDHFNNRNDLDITFNSSKSEFNLFDNISDNQKRLANLKRCTECILPETYPFIYFDDQGVCNYCKTYKKQEFLGEEKLIELLDKYKSKNGKPDCLVGLSGGRDSSYGLHLIKKKYGMNPIAYTYDWGLTTDISRVNCSKLCGQLGVEHIIRAANIAQKRSYVRKNIMAWLKKPHLGMVPIIHAGDKPNIDFGRILSKELNLKLVIQFTGYQVEQREFFLGFAGVKQKLINNQRMCSYSTFNKIKMFNFYSSQFLLNPHYINSATWDNFSGYLNAFIKKENFLHFYSYIKWDEKQITDVLNKEYNWQSDISYGKNQWRMGDGQTSFINYIYYTVAGFSEFDNFRSNQICEGLLTRNEALKLASEDNRIRYDTLKNFSEIIGLNLEDVLTQIDCIPKLY